MTRGSTAALVPILLSCLAPPLAAQESGEEEAEHRNSVELFFGAVTETGESATGPGIGVEYQRHLSQRWSVGVEAIELSTNDVSRSWLVVVPVYFTLVKGLGIKAGPGLEGSNEKPEDGGESETSVTFAMRFGTGWEFELGRRFTLTPEINMDLIGGSVTWVYGLSVGLRF